jgi:hypothetical protein
VEDCILVRIRNLLLRIMNYDDEEIYDGDEGEAQDWRGESNEVSPEDDSEENEDGER